MINSDSYLIAEFKKGDNRSFDILLNRYKDKIFTCIFHIVQDKQIAEDIFQEACIKVVKRIREGKYNEEGKFLSYITIAARNLCMDFFRYKKTQPDIESSSEDEWIEKNDYAHQECSHELVLTKRVKHEEVRSLIDMLPKDQREVLVLRHYGDMSFKEIAQTTNVSINTCLGRMRYALNNLRKIIDQKQIQLN